MTNSPFFFQILAEDPRYEPTPVHSDDSDDNLTDRQKLYRDLYYNLVIRRTVTHSKISSSGTVKNFFISVFLVELDYRFYVTSSGDLYFVDQGWKAILLSPETLFSYSSTYSDSLGQVRLLFDDLVNTFTHICKEEKRKDWRWRSIGVSTVFLKKDLAFFLTVGQVATNYATLEFFELLKNQVKLGIPQEIAQLSNRNTENVLIYENGCLLKNQYDLYTFSPFQPHQMPQDRLKINYPVDFEWLNTLETGNFAGFIQQLSNKQTHQNLIHWLYFLNVLLFQKKNRPVCFLLVVDNPKFSIFLQTILAALDDYCQLLTLGDLPNQAFPPSNQRKAFLITPADSKNFIFTLEESARLKTLFSFENTSATKPKELRFTDVTLLITTTIPPAFTELTSYFPRNIFLLKELGQNENQMTTLLQNLRLLFNLSFTFSFEVLEKTSISFESQLLSKEFFADFPKNALLQTFYATEKGKNASLSSFSSYFCFELWVFQNLVVVSPASEKHNEILLKDFKQTKGELFSEYQDWCDQNCVPLFVSNKFSFSKLLNKILKNRVNMDASNFEKRGTVRYFYSLGTRTAWENYFSTKNAESFSSCLVPIFKKLPSEDKRALAVLVTHYHHFDVNSTSLTNEVE